MTTSLLNATLFALVGLAAMPSLADQNYADEVGGFPPDTSASLLTREQVHEEVLRARRDGTLASYGEGADFGMAAQQSAAASPLTREQVREEVLRARRDGTLASYGEGADFGMGLNQSGTASQLTREQVLADAADALRHGRLPGGEI